ncbi:uncharacterized protein LOC110458506 [Mizuhopecten yessoensis]|uniref:uncharacterized protein LOC110458506 n=1 Tax=Mizuhopecten yessoensis TaxID=6573 RepID=UPI000B45C34C|nr:uncharacterized protein LOC110458506 [Mizuhopecten yessoensis]
MTMRTSCTTMPVHSPRKSSTESGGGCDGDDPYCTHVDHTTMVSKNVETDYSPTSDPAQQVTTVTIAKRPSQTTSTAETASDSLQVIRECLQRQGFSTQVTNIILASWMTSTQKQYGVHIRRWLSFCEQGTVDPLQPSVTDLLEFLSNMFHKGLGYSSVNTAKSCIKSFFELTGNTSLIENVLIKRFMKGIFHARPALPRYSTTWSVSLVLQYIQTLSPVHTISLRFLSLKLVMLLALLTGQRCQTLHLIDIRNITVTESQVTIVIGDLLKQSKPGRHLPPIVLCAFPTDSSLCVVTVLKEYLERTKVLRKEEPQLFISTISPFNKVSKQTIANWIKLVLKKSGIDTSVYKPHSTRSASMTAAKAAHVPISTILQTAGWSKECTFRKFYCIPSSHIQSTVTENVGTRLLEQFAASSQTLN